MKIIDPKFNYLKSDYYSAILREILNGCAVELYMSSLIMTLCCIDYMGIPLSGNTKNTNVQFKQFLEQYMSEVNSNYQNKTIQEIIYAIRCSLVHSFGEADALQKINITPIFEVGCDDRVHLLMDKDGNGNNTIHVSIPHLISETIAGVEKYFREVTDTVTLTEWYRRLYIIGGVGGPFNKLHTVPGGTIVYKNIHPLLDKLDDPRCTIKELYENIKTRLLEKYHQL
ncbi:MAG: hypothetical protein AMQ22_02146 [Candidatus Methanofastidiosum methylothiophilum]|uniref:Uncharacterized protein n=1 Tax=Candidatus Methanofastidiosum methylothiophilum TaxID=1705564 RepID=A0A150IP22_9EURY|nr:MAG: hypothetical protein AMQ22_02146 [Candidatus Methanofastidiosum methylthiophilus]